MGNTTKCPKFGKSSYFYYVFLIWWIIFCICTWDCIYKDEIQLIYVYNNPQIYEISKINLNSFVWGFGGNEYVKRSFEVFIF